MKLNRNRYTANMGSSPGVIIHRTWPIVNLSPHTCKLTMGSLSLPIDLSRRWQQQQSHKNVTAGLKVNKWSHTFIQRWINQSHITPLKTLYRARSKQTRLANWLWVYLTHGQPSITSEINQNNLNQKKPFSTKMQKIRFLIYNRHPRQTIFSGQ